MQQDVMYLRKSRADIQAEEQGELETLARHEKALTELALKRGYNIVKHTVRLFPEKVLLQDLKCKSFLPRLKQVYMIMFLLWKLNVLQEVIQ